MDVREALKNKYQIDFNKVAVAGDGGTIYLELIDEDDECHILFIDKRIDSKTTNHLYADHYPGEPNSVHIGIDERLLNTITKNI